MSNTLQTGPELAVRTSFELFSASSGPVNWVHLLGMLSMASIKKLRLPMIRHRQRNCEDAPSGQLVELARCIALEHECLKPLEDGDVVINDALHKR